MAWRDNNARDELNRLRNEVAEHGRRVTDELTAGLTDARRGMDDLRRELVDAINDGFGRVHAENLELRTRLDRATTDLADTRRQIETLRAEATQARLSPQQPTVEAADPGEYYTLLQTAAGTAYAALHCHRDTWDFLVAQAATGEHFRLPGDVSEEQDGRISVDVSGRTLIAILDALWHTQRASDATVGTKALATQVYARIEAAMSAVAGQAGSGGQGAEQPTPPAARDVRRPKQSNVVRIIIDDRP